MSEPNSPTRSGQRRRRAVSFDLGREMPDFASNPSVHTTQRLLCPTEQASKFLRQFEVVTRIKTLQLRRMLKGVGSEGGMRLPVRALKGWVKKRDLLEGEVGAFSALPGTRCRSVFIQIRLERTGARESVRDPSLCGTSGIPTPKCGDEPATSRTAVTNQGCTEVSRGFL